MEKEFTLIKKWLGLKPQGEGAFLFVYAMDLEARLAKGVQIGSWGTHGTWYSRSHSEFDQSTQEGLLIGVRKMPAPDTAESLLRNLVVAWGRRSSECGELETSLEFRDVLDRARKLFAKGDADGPGL